MRVPTTPSVSPFLFCADVPASQDFLVRSFGMERGELTSGPDGTAVAASVRLGDNTVFLARPHPGQMEPASAVGKLHSLVMVYLATPAEVDQMFDQAKAAGATIDYEPRDMPYGQREFGARDADGNLWSFAALLG
ncbi:VOC family protein [Amycolatopsis nigrescens]|uniref:VOC family protein n=1 Tax=Amycolatopsis nigrescens TaxID=381445 RepID=UPI000475849C|nr:VOC family protein [Amycolatopsis nigrescens]